MAMCGDTAGKLQLAGRIVTLRDGRHVGSHHPRQDVGIGGAPFIVIAATLIGAGDVDCRGKGFHTGTRAALTLYQIGGIGFRVPAKLADNRPLVADQPFIIDLVVDGMTVGDDPIGQLLPGGTAIDPVTGMGGGGQDPMRGQHSVFRRAGPDHILAKKPAIRKFGKRRHGRCNHALIAGDNRPRRAYRNIRGVIIMQRRDAALFPDFGRYPQDIVREILPFRIKSLHYVTPFPLPPNACQAALRIRGQSVLHLPEPVAARHPGVQSCSSVP